MILLGLARQDLSIGIAAARRVGLLGIESIEVRHLLFDEQIEESCFARHVEPERLTRLRIEVAEVLEVLGAHSSALDGSAQALAHRHTLRRASRQVGAEDHPVRRHDKTS
jgi:hypothetical protein